MRDILDARGRQARARALQAVDDAVSQGMAAFGFPRAPIRSLSLVTPQLPSIAGLKYITCDMQLSRPAVLRELGPGGAPDTIAETWIHESVHGRRFPWGANASAEVAFPGFEEGLAEGITRLLSHQAGFVPGLPTYGRYVQTYQALADVLGISPDAIYRSLFRLANGSVMDGFVTEVNAIRAATGQPPLTAEQRGRLDRAARRLFDIAYEFDPASARLRNSIRRAWRRAFT